MQEPKDQPVEEQPVVVKVDPTGSMEDVSDDTSEVEALLSQEIPDYAKSLQDIGAELSDAKIVIESYDFNKMLLMEVSASASPREKWVFIQRWLKKKLSDAISSILLFLKYLVIDTILEFPGKIWSVVKNLGTNLKAGISAFKDWSIVKKLLFLLVFGFIFALFGAYYFVVKGDILNKPTHLFLASFDEVADYQLNWQPDAPNEGEFFYNSSRIKVYAFEMAAFIVNLKMHPEGGKRPMGMFEFVFEGNNRDVLVELKEKESLFRDEAQRFLEELTYNELETVPGKRNMQDGLKIRFNELLTKGELLHVQIKSIILKP